MMFQSTGIMLKLWWTQLGLTPIPIAQEVVTPEEASLVFSGPQFLVALLAGVMMAFAFQLLLTNFSVAFGISSLGGVNQVLIVMNQRAWAARFVKFQPQ
jgi:hypothetical protein